MYFTGQDEFFIISPIFILKGIIYEQKSTMANRNLLLLAIDVLILLCGHTHAARKPVL